MPKGLSIPDEGKVLMECKELDNYPFRQEMEDLVKNPLKNTQEELVEEGEIIPRYLPSTLSNPDNKPAGQHKSQGSDTQERLCSPLRIMMPSLAEVATKVMASLDNELVVNDICFTPS